MVQPQTTILVAASGSGGHLIPAISIAKAIQKKLPNSRVVFVGSGRALEQKLVGSAGYKVETLPLLQIKRMGIKGIFRWLVYLPYSSLSTWKLLSKEKPSLIVGVGGYVSVLPVILGRLFGAKTIVHEAERTPGLANKALSYFVHAITSAHKQHSFHAGAPVVWTGHPLRQELLNASYFKELPDKPKNLLIVGGSQGALSLDYAALHLAPKLKELGLTVHHQCRPENQSMLEKAYEKVGITAKVEPFIANMVEVYQWSDLILARSGAGLVRELELVGRPAILVPLPRAKEQLSNAEDLVQAGQGILVIEEQLIPAGSVDETEILAADRYRKLANQLIVELEKLLDPDIYSKMTTYHQLEQSKEDPSTKIAEIAVSLISN